MKIGGYTLEISEGVELENGYVSIPHMKTFSIILRNDSNKRTTARVQVNGESVGSFRINPGRELNLERPSHAKKLFTFIASGTNEAKLAELSNIFRENLGLIQVEFVPELVSREINTKGGAYIEGSVYTSGGDFVGGDAYYSTTRSPSKGLMSDRSGGVGLTGSSDQKFIGVKPMDLDEDNKVVISLRLIRGEDVSPLHPKKIRGNPVPPPIF